MATRQVAAALTATTSLYRLYFQVFSIFAIVTVPALAVANRSSPPSTLEVYKHARSVPPDVTREEVATPSGNLTAIEFGTILVVAIPIRETAGPNSLLLGSVAGLRSRNKDLFSQYTAITFVLNATSNAGSINCQGITELGNGELVIVGGTDDFRCIKEYAELTA